MNISLSLEPITSLKTSEKKIFKFISTLSSLDIIRKLSSENQLNTGMKDRLALLKLDFNTNTYKNLVYPKLGITSHTAQEDILKKQAITLEYTKIFKKYKPSDSGELHSLFNYAELISVIKKVFKKHMHDPRRLLYTGVPIDTHENKYFAKVNAGKICIITALGKPLGKGTTGAVLSVFELVSQQFVALKHTLTASSDDLRTIQMEITNIKMIHKLMSTQSLKLEGFQDPILADFKLPNAHMIGYLSPQYDMDLVDWLDTFNASTFSRIRLCQSLMQIYMNISKLGIWHGDLKAENIMLKNDKPVVIDWTGALLLEAAASKFTMPKFSTSHYCNKIDVLTLKSLRTQKNPELKSEFIKSAKSLELFSMAMVIYMVLTSDMPFMEVEDPDLMKMMPLTKRGLKELPLGSYNDDILYIMKRMLAHQPSERFSSEEAFTAWQNIDENTGKTRTKVYKLT